jgi:tetratricopeptide (TPR) repeat protein
VFKQASIVTCVFALLLGGPTLEAHSQGTTTEPVAAAETLAREGLKFARSKRYKEAVARFEAAHKLDPRAIYAHNLARSYEELGELTRAFDFFSQALRLDGDYTYASEGRRRIGVLEKRLRKTHGRVKITSTPSEIELTLVEKGGTKTQHLRTPHLRWVRPGPLTVRGMKLGFNENIKVVDVQLGRTSAVNLTLKPIPKKGYLDVSSSQRGARVFVDGKDLGEAPLKGVLLEAGNHRVVLRHKESVLLKRDIVILPDKPFVISHNLDPMGSKQREQSIALPVSLWIAGGALMLTGVGLHVAAADRVTAVGDYPIFDLTKIDPNRADYEEVRASVEAQNSNNSIQAENALSEGQSLEIGAWIGYGLALSAAVSGTLLYLARNDNAPQSASKALPSLTLFPAVSVRNDGSTFGLSMSF